MRLVVAAALLVASLGAESVDSFIQRTLQKNPEITSMQNSLKAAYEEIGISSKLDNPELSVQTLNNDFSRPLARDISAMQQVTYAITQKIPLTAKLGSREQSKKDSYEALKNRLEQKKLDIEFEIKTIAYEIAKLKEIESNYKKYLETAKFATGLLQISSSIESGSHTELVRSQIETATFERKLTEIVAQKKIAIKKLESFGEVPNETIEIELNPKYVDLSKTDISLSNELRATSNEAKSINGELSAENKSLVPDIGVTIGYASADSRYQDFWFFGVNIPLPIYGKELASARKKGFELSSKKDEERNLRNKLTSDLEAAKFRYESALKNSKATEKIIKTQSAHLLETTLSTLKTSKSSREFVFSVIKENLSLENELAEYRAEAMSALAQIKKITGAEI